MEPLLLKLIPEEVEERGPVPEDVLVEVKNFERVLSDFFSVNQLGEQVPFNCPGCGGVLWKVDEDNALRFRCHTGHSYTAAFLLAEQTNKIEETMWTAISTGANTPRSWKV